MLSSKRMERMQAVLEKALACSKDSVLKSSLDKCFPNLILNHGDLIQNLLEQLMTTLCANIIDEFDKLGQEDELESKLTRLEQLLDQPQPNTNMDILIQEVEKSMKVLPSQIIFAQRMKIKMAERDRLRELLAQTKEQNMQLETQLEQSKTQAQDRIETFHQQFREMEEIVAHLGGSSSATLAPVPSRGVVP